MKHTEKTPLETLRYHVSGTIERGEAQAIAGIPASHASPITIEDEYRSNPSAACRKALTLTRSIENKYARLREIDRLLNNCGIESVFYKKGSLAFSYSNTGDSYATTVVLFASGAFRVTSWGDIVERGINRYS